MKTTTGQAKRARTLTERNKSLNCSNAFYHFGLILTFVGVVFTILAMATSYLFYIDISDMRKTNSNFDKINIPVGLFSAYGYKSLEQKENETWQILPEPLNINNTYNTAAAVLTIVGLIAGLIVIMIHILFCIKENFRKRKVIFVEVIFLLIAMIGVLAGLSFGETQIEMTHDDGGEHLIMFLIGNKFVTSKDVKFKDSSSKNDDAEFNVQISAPQYSFYFLIVATFMFLLAFLFSLIYFVRLCERINKEERELRENLTNPENVDPVQEVMVERI